MALRGGELPLAARKTGDHEATLALRAGELPLPARKTGDHEATLGAGWQIPVRDEPLLPRGGLQRIQSPFPQLIPHFVGCLALLLDDFPARFANGGGVLRVFLGDFGGFPLRVDDLLRLFFQIILAAHGSGAGEGGQCQRLHDHFFP